jgi:hypothetical protein
LLSVWRFVFSIEPVIVSNIKSPIIPKKNSFMVAKIKSPIVYQMYATSLHTVSIGLQLLFATESG